MSVSLRCSLMSFSWLCVVDPSAGSPQTDGRDRCLGVPRRIRVGAEGRLTGQRVRGQQPRDKERRRSRQHELAANRIQPLLREVDPERLTLAVAAKGDRAQLDLCVEVLACRIAGGAKAA